MYSHRIVRKSLVSFDGITPSSKNLVILKESQTCSINSHNDFKDILFFCSTLSVMIIYSLLRYFTGHEPS